MTGSLTFQIGEEVTGLFLTERYTLEEIQGKSSKAFASFGRQHWPEATLVSFKAAVQAADMKEDERNGLLALIDSCASSLDELH